MLTCFDVANYFLAQPDEDAGDLMSNLKLQKLVYYAQGFHLAMYDTALFNEPIEAWTHGPVVPALYHRFKEYGSNPIPPVPELDFAIFQGDVGNVLDEVYKVYGQYSAWKLRNLTHDEPPYKEALESDSPIISHESLKKYFKTQLISGEE